MSKLLVLGIDSLAPELLARYASDLPNFSRLARESPKVELISIFPIDSIPAWATVFTGSNPARHGLIYAFDVFETKWESILRIDRSVFEGKTFWDHASQAGLGVCIVFPLMAYPAWPVRGAFISRSLDGKMDAYPPALADELNLEDIDPPSGRHPGRAALLAYARRVREVTQQEAKIAARALGAVAWDLGFVYFGFLDIIEHFFWRYQDPCDPTYPGPSPLQEVIRDFYILLDSIVGELIALVPGATVIVMSDHGHGMRPPQTVNVNEFLRQKGFLKSRASWKNPVPLVMEILKRSALDSIRALELDHAMLKLSKLGVLSKVSKTVYMSKGTIDPESTIASLSSFAGPKSYPYGGIDIRRENLPRMGKTYEEVRAELLTTMAELRDPTNGERLVLWVRRREDVYTGPYIDSYPDVLFELREGYGVYWGIHCPLIGNAYEHNLASGGHRKEAVFLISNTSRRLARTTMKLEDVAPTLLDIVGVPWEGRFDGSSILAA